MTTKKLKPFRDAEEIKNVVTPQSLWQLGCDDAKAGRPRRHAPFGGKWSGYSQGYNFGLEISGAMKTGTEDEIQRHRSYEADPIEHPIPNDVWLKCREAFGPTSALGERQLYLALLRYRQLTENPFKW